ncbi:MAG: DUF4920 domain-containing protein [Aridibacter famidurans]|nr:DUF4920 domain-containing protein [Aridibacter famidurans]
MKIFLASVFVLVLSFGAFAQEGTEKKKPTDADKVAEFDSKGKISRGDALGDSEMVSLAKVMKDPETYAGKSVMVKGYVVRSCKKEGCWAELAPSMDAKTTVRVKFKDHGFFIPLASEGFKAKAEGVFSVKILSKEEVDHLIEDGSKFENRNEDGTVSEISFLASGIVLTKAE